MALILTDATANGNDLTNDTGVVPWTTDYPFVNCIGAADFEESGAGQYLHIDDVDQTGLDFQHFGNDYTIEMWIRPETKPTAIPQAQYLVTKIATDDLQYMMYFSGDDRLRMNYWDEVQNLSRYRTNVGYPPSTGSWQHVAITVDVGAKTFSFYWNGSPIFEEPHGTPAATSVNDGTGPFEIGGRSDASATTGFDGAITEIRAWDHVRSPAQIADNKDDHVAVDSEGLLAYWPFMELSSPLISPFPSHFRA